jgi:hypothetical protein
MLRITRERVSVSQKKLRRLGARALQLMRRYDGIDPMYTALARMLIPAAERFIANYDARAQSDSYQQIRAGRHEVTALRRALRRWSMLLRSTAPALAARHTPKSVPDDVIAQAKGLVKDLSPSGAFADADVPFAKALIEHLSSLIGAAEAAWAQTRGNVATAQERQQELRAAARELQGHLITFRQLLLDSVGRHHTDYQTLRVRRRSDTTDEGACVDSEGSARADDGLLGEPPDNAATNDSDIVETTGDVSEESSGVGGSETRGPLRGGVPSAPQECWGSGQLPMPTGDPCPG